MAVFNVKSLFDSVVGKFTTTLEELSIFDTTNATGGGKYAFFLRTIMVVES